MSSKKSKKTIIHDSIEQLSEFSRDTARKAVTEITSAFNPLASNFENPTKKEREQGNNNFTDLDFEKLQKNYDGQDSSQLDAVRSQLGHSSEEHPVNPKQEQYDYHQRVKREEEEYLAKKEQEEEEEKRQEAYEEEEKKRQEQEAARQPLETPKGKVRRSILGGKGNQKSSTELPPELKTDAGRG